MGAHDPSGASQDELPPTGDAPDVIAFRNVVKVLGGRRVLDGVTVSVPRGRVTVLMGPSGVGKTVCVKHVLGLLQPDSGDVLVEGTSVPEMTGAELLETRLRFGAMLQGSRQFDCGLFNSATLYQNVAFALQQNGVPPDRQEETAIQWLARVGLEKQRHMLPHEVSAGMRKRAALARALAPETSIVVLDDFDGGLDPVRVSLMCDLLLELQARRGCSVLVTTHSTPVATRLADVLAVLLAGRIAACGPPMDLLAHENPLPADEAGPVQAFLRGDRHAVDGAAEHFENGVAADEPRPARPATIVLLSTALIVLTTLILYLLIPVLRGDVSLNPYN